MSDKADAWFPLWIGAYLADTMHLTTAQHGAYLLLLMAYWRAGQALPDDDESLRAISRCERAEWKKMRPVIAEFFTVEGGVWRQKRAEAELEVAGTRKAKATEKAERGAATRWSDQGGPDAAERGRHLRSQRMSEARAKGTHTPAEWEAMKAFHGGACVRCKAGDAEIVKDHIVPLYQGGSDALENLQPMCRKCNAAKGPDATDYRIPGWRDACSNASEMPARCLPDACPTPSPITSSLRSETPNSLRLFVPEVPKTGLGDQKNGIETALPECPAEEVIALYHEILPELPRVERITRERRVAMRQRWREWAAENHWERSEQGLEEWRRFFEYVRGSDFLMGKKKPTPPRTVPFLADFDFLMNESRQTRVFEGRYHEQA